MRADAALGEAAATHAKQLLEARMADRPTSDVVSLADLVAAQRARTGAPVEVSGEVSRQRRHTSRGAAHDAAGGGLLALAAVGCIDAAIASESQLSVTKSSAICCNTLVLRPGRTIPS